MRCIYITCAGGNNRNTAVCREGPGSGASRAITDKSCWSSSAAADDINSIGIDPPSPPNAPSIVCVFSNVGYSVKYIQSKPLGNNQQYMDF